MLPAAVLDPARDGFAWLADVTGAPRDLDVYLLEWDRYTDPLGAERRQRSRRSASFSNGAAPTAHVELERALRSERAAELMGDWRRWLAEPLASRRRRHLPRRAGRPLGRLVAKRIARAHGVADRSAAA